MSHNHQPFTVTPGVEPAASRQELWITLRFKGEADSSADPQNIAQRLLDDLQSQLVRPNHPTGFSACQPGDIIEIEEEAHIYKTAGNSFPIEPEDDDQSPSMPFVLQMDGIDKKTFTLRVGDAAKVVIKREDEGVVVDILSLHDESIVASTYAFDSDFAAEEEGFSRSVNTLAPLR